jgi:hypothetical protein
MKNFTPYKGATGRKKPISPSESNSDTIRKDIPSPNYSKQSQASTNAHRQALKPDSPSEYRAQRTLKELGRRYESYIDYHSRMSESVQDDESNDSDNGE